MNILNTDIRISIPAFQLEISVITKKNADIYIYQQRESCIWKADICIKWVKSQTGCHIKRTVVKTFSQIKSIKVALGNKEHIEEQKCISLLGWRGAQLTPALSELHFPRYQNGVSDSKSLVCDHFSISSCGHGT